MKAVTPAQIKKLHAISRERGIDDDLLHEHIMMMTGKESIRELSCSEAIKVIDSLEGKVSTGKDHASARQLSYITGLVKNLGWVDENGNADMKRLDGMCKKSAGVQSHKWLNRKQASDLIEALKSMGQKCKLDRA